MSRRGLFGGRRCRNTKSGRDWMSDNGCSGTGSCLKGTWLEGPSGAQSTGRCLDYRSGIDALTAARRWSARSYSVSAGRRIAGWWIAGDDRRCYEFGACRK